MSDEFKPFDDSKITRITIECARGTMAELWSVRLEMPTVTETHHPFKSAEQAVWSLMGRLARHTDSLVMVGAGGTSSMQKPKVKGEGESE